MHKINAYSRWYTSHRAEGGPTSNDKENKRIWLLVGIRGRSFGDSWKVLSVNFSKILYIRYSAESKIIKRFEEGEEEGGGGLEEQEDMQQVQGYGKIGCGHCNNQFNYGIEVFFILEY